MTDGLMSNSEIRTYKTCRREWWLTYYRRLRRKRRTVTGPAYTGTRVHKALQVYYDDPGVGGKAAARAVLAAMVTADMERVPEEAEDIGKESELASIMVDGYFEWLDETGADHDLEVIEAERKVVTRSPVDGVELVAKLDVSVRRRSDGVEGHLDHKTVANLTDPVKILHLDEQRRQYALMHRIANPDAPARNLAIINMLRKVKRTAKANPPFYGRYETYVSDIELRAFWNRLYGEINDIVRTERQLGSGVHHRVAAYPTPTRDCTWRCEFFDICGLFDDDASDPEHLLNELFEEHDPHERYEEDAGADSVN